MNILRLVKFNDRNKTQSLFIQLKKYTPFLSHRSRVLVYRPALHEVANVDQHGVRQRGDVMIESILP